MLNRFLIVFVFFISSFILESGGGIYCQNIRFGDTKVTLGILNGLSPNYELGKGGVFFMGGLEQDVTIKNISFRLSGRVSNEPFRSGVPSFIRFSYQPKKRDLFLSDSILNQLQNLRTEKLILTDSLSQIESKIAYLYQLKVDQQIWGQLKKQNHFDTLTNGLIKIDTSLNYSLPTLNIQSFDSAQIVTKSSLKLPETDLNQLELSKYSLQSDLLKLDSSILKYESEYKEIKQPISPSFLNGIRRFDFGMTSLGGSWGTNNAVPIQGIHVKGKYRRILYDLAAGFSVPNRLFTSNVSDQLLNNNLNPYNFNDFFAVSESRFVSAATISDEGFKNVRYGLENYYTGRSFSELKNKEKLISTLTSNVFASYNIPFIKGFSIGLKAGSTYLNPQNDSIRFEDKSMAQVKLKWELLKFGSKVDVDSRKIGFGYSGWTQGIYLKGFEDVQLNYSQRLSSKMNAGIRASITKFLAKNPFTNVNTMNLLALNYNYSFKPLSLIYLNAGWISTDVNPRLDGSNYNYSGGVKWVAQFDDFYWENTAEFSSFKMSTLDSVQQVDQYSLKTGYRLEHWYFGLKGIYQNYSGLQRVYGENKILQLELGVKFNKLQITAIGSQLISNQFKTDNGLILEAMISPTQFFCWKINVQRWLKSDLVFFNSLDFELPSPWFMNLQMIIKINKK